MTSLSRRLAQRPPISLRCGRWLILTLVLATLVLPAVVTGVVDGVAQSRRLDRRQERLESAPVPDHAVLMFSGRTGNSIWRCSINPGCNDPGVEAAWRLSLRATCDVPADVAKAWGLTRVRDYGTDCFVDGYLDGAYVSLSIDSHDDQVLRAHS